MVSDLTRFRDHCRTMADPNAWAAAHPWPKGISWACDPRSDGQVGHGECTWGWQSCRCTCHDRQRPVPPTERERLFWTRLADEIGDWLTNGLQHVDPEDHTAPLWEHQ